MNILDADGKKPTDVARCKRHSDIANFYSNLHILGIGNQLRFNNLALNCFDTTSETAWTNDIHIFSFFTTGSLLFILL